MTAIDADLQRIVLAWGKISGPIRKAIVAFAESSRERQGSSFDPSDYPLITPDKTSLDVTDAPKSATRNVGQCPRKCGYLELLGNDCDFSTDCGFHPRSFVHADRIRRVTALRCEASGG